MVRLKGKFVSDMISVIDILIFLNDKIIRLQICPCG